MSTFIYRSTDAGAPGSITGATSGVTLAAVIRGCLIAGYNTQSGITATQVGGVATFTKSSHGYVVGQVLPMTGFTTTGYNVTGPVLSVPSSSTWTMAVSAAIATPAVGTGSAIVAAANVAGNLWTEPFPAAGGIAVFRQPTVGANGSYWRLDENTDPKSAQARWYESMSALSTGTNPCPTLAQVALGSGPYIFKSNTNDSTARPWELFTNGKWIILLIKNNVQRSLYYFGDPQSLQSGDLFHTMLAHDTTAAATGISNQALSNCAAVITSASAGHWMLRKYDQSGTAITINRASADAIQANSSQMGAGSMPYPNGPDGTMRLIPLNLFEASNSGHHRGSVPGLWYPAHALASIVSTNDKLLGTGTLAGKAFEFFLIGSSAAFGVVAIETSDTWIV